MIGVIACYASNTCRYPIVAMISSIVSIEHRQLRDYFSCGCCCFISLLLANLIFRTCTNFCFLLHLPKV